MLILRQGYCISIEDARRSGQQDLELESTGGQFYDQITNFNRSSRLEVYMGSTASQIRRRTGPCYSRPFRI